ncbi:hypothetical protein V6N12_014117 [Hibiscus sabdariffa]|uniref:Uncharacterized protein n=1 Tax=Hibiscus sabdariffa TaxID=183260 RepID=A0ABR2DJ68_9ROSI
MVLTQSHVPYFSTMPQDLPPHNPRYQLETSYLHPSFSLMDYGMLETMSRETLEVDMSFLVLMFLFHVGDARSQGKAMRDEAGEQTVGYTGKVDISADNEKLREHLQGMQCRVMELEQVCKKMQSQMAKFIKSKAAAGHTTPRLMPRFCS